MTEKNKREEERLNTLYSYDILDTRPEQEYDEITKIAAEVCKMPMSLVSLIDPSRQWFKSHHGLGLEETPRGIAFCNYAIQDPENIMIVPDLRKDKRFSENPLVTNEPHIVFYAGAPLVDASGHALGTLCVLDREARELNEGQLETLSALSNQVVRLLELRKKNKQLEERERELERKNGELEQFVYMVSHDLNDPLSSIQGLLDVLKFAEPVKEDEKVSKIVEMLIKASSRTRRLVADLLQYARINVSPKDKPIVTCDLNEIIEEVKESLMLRIKESNARIIIEDKLPEIEGSKVELERLFQNLISNAIKFRRNDEEPVIKISASVEGAYLLVCVEDNGIGISREDSEKLFQAFKRLHSQSGFEGTGLGLAICKKIVENHEGKIWIDSHPEKGSKFYLTLLIQQK